MQHAYVSWLTLLTLLLKVFGAVRQALQRAPHYPESYNLNGLVYEARHDYKTAAVFYRLAQCAICALGRGSNSSLRDISTNLARSLCKVNMFVLVFPQLMSKNSSCHTQCPFYGKVILLIFLQAGNAVDAVVECEYLKKEGEVIYHTC